VVEISLVEVATYNSMVVEVRVRVVVEICSNKEALVASPEVEEICSNMLVEVMMMVEVVTYKYKVAVETRIHKRVKVVAGKCSSKEREWVSDEASCTLHMVSLKHKQKTRHTTQLHNVSLTSP
jgi:hypothetical protein